MPKKDKKKKSKRERKPTAIKQVTQMLDCAAAQVPEQVKMLLSIVQQPWAVVTIAFHPRIEGPPTMAIQGVPEGKVGLRMVQKRLLMVARDITDVLDRIELEEQAKQKMLEEIKQRDKDKPKEE